MSDNLKETIQQIPNNSDLREAIKAERLIVFAGAGISRRFGLPDWGNLVSEIIDDLQDKKPADHGLSCLKTLIKEKWLTLLQVINLLQNKYERDVIRFVQNRLVIRGNHDFSLHKKILKLTEKIVTTNYDKAFERASENQLQVVYNDNRFSMGRLQKIKGFLFKLHGNIDELENCVFFENQYQELYKSEPEHIAIRELKTIFKDKTILFIGFGLNDPYIEEIFRSLNEQYSNYLDKHYIITTDQNFVNSKYAEYIEPFLIGDYSETETVLEEMLKIKEEGPEQERRHNLKAKYFDFIGREEYVNKVMEGLKGELPLVVIQGLPGIGKTSLVTEVGYACIDQSTVKYSSTVLFDFVVWFSPRENPSSSSWWCAVLDEIGRVMKNRRIMHESEEESKANEINNYLRNSGKKLLVIIDEFDNIPDGSLRYWITDKLTPTSGKVLVTTREHIPEKQSNNYLEGFALWESIKFIQQLTVDKGKGKTPIFRDNNTMMSLVNVTNANPRALELAIGCIRNGKLDLPQEANELGCGSSNIIHNLHERSWVGITESSRTVLSLFPQFLGSHSIPEDALYNTCSLSKEEVRQTLEELLNWNLIYLNLGQRYTIHPYTLEFVKDKLHPSNNKPFKENWSKYYLSFTRSIVVRESPNTAYWNALVSERMNDLEEEWTAIQEVMQWADNNGKDELLVELVMLLVHFMDSRFYNQARITFVNKAIVACRKTGKKYEEALLLIDALGWTYAEESRFEEALSEIEKGLSLLGMIPSPSKDIDNLKALAYAWQARIKLERELEGHIEESYALLQKAKDFRDIDPWIETRIKMAEGDIEMQKENFVDAALCYLEAEKLTDPDRGGYGFEGQNYQINPRIGFAKLEIAAMEQDKKKAEEGFHLAKDRFEKLVRDRHIAIGWLYSKYGLARITYEEGQKLNDVEMQQSAIHTIEEIDKELSQRTTSNLLKKLIEKFIANHLGKTR